MKFNGACSCKVISHIYLQLTVKLLIYISVIYLNFTHNVDGGFQTVKITNTKIMLHFLKYNVDLTVFCIVLAQYSCAYCIFLGRSVPTMF